MEGGKPESCGQLQRQSSFQTHNCQTKPVLDGQFLSADFAIGKEPAYIKLLIYLHSISWDKQLKSIFSRTAKRIDVKIRYSECRFQGPHSDLHTVPIPDTYVQLWFPGCRSRNRCLEQRFADNWNNNATAITATGKHPTDIHTTLVPL
jgi:hypothetical protein